MAPKLWAPDALWVLPPSPYENHTPKADALEKAKWVLVGATLFLPRLLVAVVTSACARRRRKSAKKRTRGACTSPGRAHKRRAALRSLARLDRRARLHRGLAARLKAAGARPARLRHAASRLLRAHASCASRALRGPRLTRCPAAPRRTCRSRLSAGVSCARPAPRHAATERDCGVALHMHQSRLASPGTRPLPAQAAASHTAVSRSPEPVRAWISLHPNHRQGCAAQGGANRRVQSPGARCRRNAVSPIAEAPHCLHIAGLSRHLALPVALPASRRVCG